MSNRHYPSIPQVTGLAGCLAAILNLTPDVTQAVALPRANDGQSAYFELNAPRSNMRTYPARHASLNHNPAILSVDTCADDGSPGSLRQQIGAAMSGDTIDLSQLSCSTITLDGSWTPPYLEIDQYKLYLKGPTSAAEKLTIDGGNNSSVFVHFGTGKLDISDLSIANASYVSGAYARGGCIYSAGDVALTRSIVSGCWLKNESTNYATRGAGIYAKGDVTLSFSTITDAHVFAMIPTNSNTGFASGGGVFCSGSLHAKYSTISKSSAFGGLMGMGGGAMTGGELLLGNSTLSGNYARSAGGIKIAGSAAESHLIVNSTISGNNALASTNYGDHSAGISASVPLTIVNSTVAFNFGQYAPGFGIVSTSALTLQSSIVADNFSRDLGPGDIDGSAGAAITVVSSNNLIVASTLPVPADTISKCPQLQPLADNGGPTRTHQLSSTSPAVDHGSNPQHASNDQRRVARTFGVSVDIGSVERQGGERDERILADGFDGLCDQ